jgi:hypothetical protein
MAPKRVIGGRPSRAPQGFFASTYDTLTSSENAAMVRSIGVFAVSHNEGGGEWFLSVHAHTVDQVAVAVLSSSWGELLLPP